MNAGKSIKTLLRTLVFIFIALSPFIMYFIFSLLATTAYHEDKEFIPSIIRLLEHQKLKSVSNFLLFLVDIVAKSVWSFLIFLVTVLAFEIYLDSKRRKYLVIFCIGLSLIIAILIMEISLGILSGGHI
ncbi:MAG: hypothetical protein AMJ78_00705 [Omnitrophica WOR_2 bacterium SM23_29]|nr:MAG: hypothetical protein AMJ78_00705 [Omnitrophica WOR_2 bacterium SM23_29]